MIIHFIFIIYADIYMCLFFLSKKGCFFHGCSRCFDGEVINQLNGFTMATLNRKTEEMTEKFRSLGYNVIEKWEHEFVLDKKQNGELRQFLLTHNIEDRLDPREAFFGGRTNALKLQHQGKAKYVDFTSLYPWVRFFSFLTVLYLLIKNKVLLTYYYYY